MDSPSREEKGPTCFMRRSGPAGALCHQRSRWVVSVAAFLRVSRTSACLDWVGSALKQRAFCVLSVELLTANL